MITRLAAIRSPLPLSSIGSWRSFATAAAPKHPNASFRRPGVTGSAYGPSKGKSTDEDKRFGEGKKYEEKKFGDPKKYEERKFGDPKKYEERKFGDPKKYEERRSGEEKKFGGERKMEVRDKKDGKSWKEAKRVPNTVKTKAYGYKRAFEKVAEPSVLSGRLSHATARGGSILFPQTSQKIRTPAKDFSLLGLSPLVVQGISTAIPTITQPTLIQTQAIPEILKRDKDVIMASQTGTGKTLSYLLPIIHHIKEDEKKVPSRDQRPAALVLVPNRELCQQVGAVAKQLSHFIKFRTTQLTGGQSKHKENRKTEGKIDLIIATPGRLLEAVERGHLFLTDVRHVVVDEADTMFDKDFGTELDKIFLPIKGRKTEIETYIRPTQFVVCSATLPEKVRNLIQKQFQHITVVKTPDLHHGLKGLKQEWVTILGKDKFGALNTILLETQGRPTIVFCNTIESCRATEHHLNELGFVCSNFHGEIPYKERQENWERFKRGESRVLVCTDIASRGLDTTFVDDVILFDFPSNSTDYIHRVGRTARAGRNGKAVCFVAAKDRPLANEIKKVILSGGSMEDLLAADRLNRLGKTE
ncbi:DEAD-box ATP-dependent RNA helicase 39 [Planoprotostelium fungivorum]|uniref:DEAD-box ATP-dependent RNA helicase 39 n=1 Tax=Planoprotostelium fungivorum TaxID=1890364 RepID=A0A2P6P0R8_9EUKA|nr:DEAD-box ATP-dependent RNA helicase 39 [Planoprotostelium fungivorum]